MAVPHALSSPYSFASPHRFASPYLLADDAAPVVRARKASLLRRLYHAVLRSQMRRAQCEIDRKLSPGALATAFRAELPPRR